jgi:hypothetical protein
VLPHPARSAAPSISAARSLPAEWPAQARACPCSRPSAS